LFVRVIDTYVYVFLCMYTQRVVLSVYEVERFVENKQSSEILK
jgi:hypothetical protein